MTLSISQYRHLVQLQLADAHKEHNKCDRREWRWRPHLKGPLIRAASLYALERRKLARWLPNTDGDAIIIPGGRMVITVAGKQFLNKTT